MIFQSEVTFPGDLTVDMNRHKVAPNRHPEFFHATLAHDGPNNRLYVFKISGYIFIADPLRTVYYRLYTGNTLTASKFALQPNHPNLSAIDVNTIAPPFTVENIAAAIMEREHVLDNHGRSDVYIDHTDPKPASLDTIINIIEGPSTKPLYAIRIVLPRRVVKAGKYLIKNVGTGTYLNAAGGSHEHDLMGWARDTGANAVVCCALLVLSTRLSSCMNFSGSLLLTLTEHANSRLPTTARHSRYYPSL